MLFLKIDADFGHIPTNHLNLNMMGKVVSKEWIAENTTLPNFNYPVKFYRFHITPPNGKLNPHIDGTVESRRKFALNIPVVGKYNHTMTWYKDDDNWHTDYVEPRDKLGNAKGGVPIDVNKIEIIEQTIIDKPTLLRTDTPHSLENYNDFHRIILSIRFEDHDDFEEMLNENTHKNKTLFK